MLRSEGGDTINLLRQWQYDSCCTIRFGYERGERVLRQGAVLHPRRPGGGVLPSLNYINKIREVTGTFAELKRTVLT